MKLFLLSSLLALAAAQDVESERGLLNPSDKFHVGYLGGNAGNTNVFKCTARHEEGDNGKGTSTFYWSYRKVCGQGMPHGSKNPNYMTWVKINSLKTVKSGTNYKTTFNMVVDPKVAGTSYWTNKSNGGIAKWCTKFQLGDANDGYGFRELFATMTFVFDGYWKPIGFATQAYGQTYGAGKKTYKAIASRCGPYTNKPGKVLCVKVCPPKGSKTFIKKLYWLQAQETTTTPAPNAVNILTLKYSKTTCGVKNGSCCVTKYLLSHRFYPQGPSEKPKKTYWLYKGKAKFSCQGCGTKLNRALSEVEEDLETEDRELQAESAEESAEEDESLENQDVDEAGDGDAVVEDGVELELSPADDSGSAGVAAGAAAAAAMGAALLI